MNTRAVLRVLEAFQESTSREKLRRNGYSCVGLHHPQNPLNVGSVVRACACFDAAFVAIAGASYRKNSTDVKHDYRRIPIIEVRDLREVIPYSCVPVAVELVEGAIPLPEFEHPPRSFYIFGGEHETLGKKVLDWCKKTVFVPTRGCLNLAACVNIVLYDRAAKLFSREIQENDKSE